MRNTLKVPLAVAAGYLLGRKRKMRWAMALAAGAATGSVGGLAGKAVKFGGKQLGSSDALSKVSPELGQVAETVKGDLGQAAKSAAKAAVTNRIDALAHSLHERTQSLASPADAGGEQGNGDEEGQDEGQAPERERPVRERQSRERPSPERPSRDRPARERPARPRPADRERRAERERPGPRERRRTDSEAEVDDR